MNTVIILILWVGSQHVDQGILAKGEIIAYANYITQILLVLIVISNLVVIFTKAFASAHRVNQVLDTTSSLPETLSADTMTVITDKKASLLSLQDVSFRYSPTGDMALSHVSVDIERGETIGIIGGTGSAKSTLVNLIARLYDATEGTVRVGGVDVRDYDLDALRHQVAMVLQKNVLFSGTIAENLRWGDPNATDEEVREAAHLACADEFVDGFPKGYDTWIEQGGSNVSGGQKQRLCIARALLRRPKILILDDSTSAVDTKTDAKIRAGLASYLPNTTKLIIAQRISSVQDADRIIVMEGGRIKDIGNHDELLKTSEIYRETFTSQNKMSAEGEGAVEADTEASVTQAQTQEGGEAHE